MAFPEGTTEAFSVPGDAALLARIVEGDRGAFEQLYGAYQKRLFGYFYRALGQVAEAEELVNDVMVELWKNAGRFRGESKPSTWIIGIAHHRLLNQLRRRRPEGVGLDEVSAYPDPAAAAESDLLRAEKATQVRAALRRLSADHREVVELTFIRGCSYEEIARIMQCPVNTVKTRMFHAKKKLHEVLGKMGLGRDRDE